MKYKLHIKSKDGRLLNILDISQYKIDISMSTPVKIKHYPTDLLKIIYNDHPKKTRISKRFILLGRENESYIYIDGGALGNPDHGFEA